MRSYFLVSFFLLIYVFPGYSQDRRIVYKDSSFIRAVVQQHNTYREALQLPGLTWSPALAADALVWAKHLAEIDKGQHDMDVRGKEGENLWWGTAGAFSYADMVTFWGNEKSSFHYGVFPDVGTSRSAMVGHYTQVVWKNTQSVGCALVSNGKNDYLVCRYSPAGNVLGEKPY
jgi:uncharacterized protein YkwD